MSTSQAADAQYDPVNEVHAVAHSNSSLTYGLGNLGLMAIAQAFRGYYPFYYVDVLGLAVALAATTLTHTNEVHALLAEPVPDQAAPYVLLNKIRNLNLELISVAKIESNRKDAPQTGEERANAE